MVDVVFAVVVVGVFIAGWLIGFISGHSKGKVDAYEAERNDAS
jgi:hypothetical protein